MTTSRVVRVGSGTPGEPASPPDYDVVIGRDLAAQVPVLVGDRARRVLVVHAAAVRDAVATVSRHLHAAGLQVVALEPPDGEAAKTAAILERGWGVLGRAGFTRTDVVVGVGGGAVTDLAGFLAATWLRGVPVVQVPTTLLGMVDAAVGGKTGINTAEGKNLVGAFHPPAGVLCDLDHLSTLPRADLMAGMAEVVKCGFIADPGILDAVEADPAAATDCQGLLLPDLVERSIAVKARVVSADLKESGLREVLNYGHTFGHAVEQVEGYSWRHGEAVSVGMVFAAELGRLAGRLDDAAVGRHRVVLEALGLPLTYRGDRWPQLLVAMSRDKKARGASLRFVVLSGVGRPERLEDPPVRLLEQAYAAVSG